MLRNLGVTAVVSAIMGVTTLALQSIAPSATDPTMDAEAQADPTSEQAPEALSAMEPTSQTFPTDGQAGQTAGSPFAANQAGGGMMGGGMMGGGQGADGAMMCPCMQMMMGMMGGDAMGMGGDPMGGQANPSGAAVISNPRTKDQARQRAQEYLTGSGNPNLKIGELNETAASYEIQVITQDDSPVNWIIIDKQSGELKTQY